MPGPATAQQIASSATLDFSTSGQSMWTSGPTVDFNDSLTLFGFSTGQLGGSAFGGDLTLSGSFGAALIANLSASAGALALDYPLNAGFNMPNLVAPGQDFTINTAANGLNTATPGFTADFPQASASLDLVTTGGIHAGFDSFLLGSFSFDTSFSHDIPLVSLSTGQSLSILDGHLVFSIPSDYNSTSVSVSGTTGLPDVTFDGATDSFVSAQEDLVDLLTKLLGLPENPFSGSYLDGAFKYDILSATLAAGVGFAQQFKFVPTGITADITAPWGEVEDVALGQSATFTMPDSWTGPVNLTTNYILHGNIESQLGFVGNLDFNLSILSATLGPLSFGPLFSQDFPLFQTGPLYVANPGGPNGFALEGFNTESGSFSIDVGTGEVTTPGGGTIDTSAFTANSTALIQTTLDAAAGGATATNIYDPSGPAGSATAVGSKLNVEVVNSPSGTTYQLPAGFQAGILEPGSGNNEIDGNSDDKLLAAAAGAGHTDTIVAGGHDTLVGGQDGNTNFVVTSAFDGQVAGLVQGDVIDVTDIGFDSTGNATLGTGNLLTLNEGGNGHTIQLSPYEDLSGDAFKISSDGANGTDITLVAPPPPPAPPTLDPGSDSNVVGDNITNVNTPQIDGSGNAGDVVTLSDGGTSLGSTTIPGSGDWSITTGTLSDGVHDLTMTTTDANNIASKPSQTLSLTIDTTPPPAPSALSLDPSTDDGAAGDNLTSNPAPEIDGKGEAGDTVTLSEGAATLGAGTVDPNGGWSIASSTLTTGPHSLTATETDLAGNASAPSSPLDLTIGPPPIGPTGPNQPFYFGNDSQYAVGTSGDDVMWGNTGNSFIAGLGGNDIVGVSGSDNSVAGNAGNDTAVAIGTNDTLAGGDDSDFLFASGNGNSLDGGNGNDTIWAVGDNDTVLGGAGDDFVGLVGSGGTIDGGLDDDTVFALGGGNTISGGNNTNTLYLAGGNNIFEDTTGRYHDTVFGFNQAAGDRIHLTTDTAANAVSTATSVNFGLDTLITLGDGSTITLKFVNNLSTSFFA